MRPRLGMISMYRRTKGKDYSRLYMADSSDRVIRISLMFFFFLKMLPQHQRDDDVVDDSDFTWSNRELLLLYVIQGQLPSEEMFTDIR